jgi:hypothetical protein
VIGGRELFALPRACALSRVSVLQCMNDASFIDDDAWLAGRGLGRGVSRSRP